MKLSVILPCFNGAKTIALQLEALARQEWSQPWELIVSNNGSTDDSMQIVEQYRDRLPHLRIVQAYDPSGPRLGVAHSYNVGIQAARGEAVAFCEADDEIAPGWVAAMGEALSRYDFVAGRLDYAKLNEPWLLQNNPRTQETGLLTYADPPYLPYASGCNLGMRRSLYESVGPLDEQIPYSYDTEYCWRAQLSGYTLHFVPDALTYYRLRADLAGLYRQGRNWGKDHIFLRQKYSSQKVGYLRLLQQFLRTTRYLPQVLTHMSCKGKTAQWFWHFGWNMGLLQGSLKAYLDNFEKNGLIVMKSKLV